MKLKIKSFLSFLLSLIIVFSVTPTTVFAADFSTNQFWVLENGPDSNYIDKSFNGSCNVYSSAKWSTINSFIIYPNYINKMGSNPMYLDSGDVINCSFNIDVSEMSSGTYFVDYDYYASSDLSDMEFGDILDTRPLGNGNISFSFTVEQSGYYVISVNIKPNNKSASSFGHLKISDFKIESESENTSLLKRIVSFFKELFNHLSSGLESIGSWFSDLGDKIGNFFSNLINNIRSFFTDLKDNLKELFDNVGQWFKDIGDKISGFFEKLWNRIWWGNENGESEYQKPVINNKLNDILDKLQEYQENLKSAITTINSAADDVAAYISTGTDLVNGVIGVAGAGFTALIVFGIVFILVRKVVGR